MGFLVLAVLLFQIEATLQFRNIPRDHPLSRNDYDKDYDCCIVRTIEKLQEDTATNVRFYSDDDLANEASKIARSLFDMKKLISVVMSNPYQFHQRRIVYEKICISVVNNETSLRKILTLLYREIHHRMCIICLKFPMRDRLGKLAGITRDIWTSGVARNVIFIVADAETEFVKIIGVPVYSRGNCLQSRFVEVGQCRDGKFRVYEAGLYPRLNDLGGCELSVMVQPSMPPYVERMENSPGGMIGDLMELMGKSMNFTPNYVWSVSHEDMINHLYSRDLNLMVDMTPRATIPITDYRFSVGVVGVTFIVPRKYKRKMWNNFFAPFDRSIWLVIAIVLIITAALSTLSNGLQSSIVVLKIFGTLLGIAMHRMISENGWLRVFLWFWLLPAYILVQTYLAYLTKNITVPIFVPEIETLADLAKSQLDLMCSNSTKNALCKINEEPFRMLCGKCRIVNDTEIWSDFYPNLMQTGRMNGKSTIANFEFLDAHPAFLNVHAVRDSLIRVNQLMEVRPGSVWIFEMEKIWERIFASGLVHYWRRRYTDGKKRKAATESIRKFHPEFGWYSFVLLIAGWIVSFAAFILELIVSPLC